MVPLLNILGVGFEHADRRLSHAVTVALVETAEVDERVDDFLSVGELRRRFSADHAVDLVTYQPLSPPVSHVYQLHNG